MPFIYISLPEIITISSLEALSSFLLKYCFLCEALYACASRQGTCDLSLCSHSTLCVPLLQKLILFCSGLSMSLPLFLVSELLEGRDSAFLVFVTLLPSVI